METILLSGLAASGLLMTGSGASASDSSTLGRKTNVTEAMSFDAQDQKGGAGMNIIMGVSMRSRPHISSPRPGLHEIPRSDAYRRPYRGFVMPRYWVQPSFYIPNYRIYGLSVPSRGYNWSRYYDDAVLLDERGFVQDYRSGIAWNAGYRPQNGIMNGRNMAPPFAPMHKPITGAMTATLQSPNAKDQATAMTANGTANI